ncbi:MAG: ABC transporter permease [Acidobacteriia bacterium]|nr:ABC transporter permease [Terriglobia bacterium]
MTASLSAADLLTIVRLEFVSAGRLRWVRLLSAAFALLSVAAAYAAGATSELAGPDGFARTTMTLVPVVLVLVPLSALVLGISGQATEPGSEAFLFTQTVSRSTIVLGRWLGEVAALGGAIVAGLGAGAIVVTFMNGADGLAQYACFVAASVVLGVIFLSLAAVIAAATERRTVALGVGVFTWFFFVLLYDGAVLSLAGWMTGSAGGRLLFGSVFGNPADLVRVVTLSVAGTPNVLGAAGDAWIRFLGGPALAFAAATTGLAAWIVAPLAAATHLIARRDL